MMIFSGAFALELEGKRIEPLPHSSSRRSLKYLCPSFVAGLLFVPSLAKALVLRAE
jgi:hypothetical protein